MKETGITRQLDSLGRIAIPKELRRTFQIEEGDYLEFYVEGDRMVLEKYQPGNILPNISKIFTEVYELVQRNSEIVGILMGDNGEWNFINRLNQILREKCLRDWVEHFRAESHETFDTYYVFIISGCMGLVQYWLANGMKETPQELAELTEQIIMNGMKWLKTE